MGLMLSKSAATFDGWIVELFKSLDGSDTHWAMPKFRKSPLRNNLGMICRIDHFKCPRFDSEEKNDDGLKGWEWAVEYWGDILIAAKSLKLHQLAELAAAEIGFIISARLLKGDFGAPRIVSEGLLNRQAGKPFMPRTGRKQSGDLDDVLWAFLELEGGGDRPSQSEVMNHLKAQGKPIGRDRVSKAFKEYKLADRASDARDNLSDAGKRRRRKAHVAN